MAQATLVEMQIKDGQRLLDQLTKEGVAIPAAGWVKENESGQWYFYIATPLVSKDGGKRPAYRRVNNVVREMQKEGFWIDPFEIKVIGPHDLIAKDMLAHRVSRPTRIPTRFEGARLGELAVDEAYIYPPPLEGRWVFIFEYRRRDETTHWDVVSPGHCVRWAQEDSWNDGKVRFEQQGGKVVIRVYSEEALQEEDATPAEELAEQEFQKRFPGHTIAYAPEAPPG